ncbi:predicted protein [Naegleria gruberi]|uniref:Predicted protein n=1 Tax=Naegleria gruberi TaxID=5762 RepID=D2W168_NAEGR|nr:uncharacterized protein NAEGRDRAFT_75108 [Naegleria gruberi]EFC37129.1 predicted protein [Naegleria gruberi]|eukprot:XP_002669873.1 predicted protein [Naegleria gruberi strain NEG-M]
MVKEAQSVLNICCASLLSEMLSFLQFETGEPSKQIVNFCVKCAADFGSIELCKYLLEKCDLINQQFDGCLKTYNVWIEDLKKRIKNDRVIGTNYHIDKKSVHISPQEDESYYEAEIEESKRNYPQFLSLRAAYASDFI